MNKLGSAFETAKQKTIEHATKAIDSLSSVFKSRLIENAIPLRAWLPKARKFFGPGNLGNLLSSCTRVLVEVGRKSRAKSFETFNKIRGASEIGENVLSRVATSTRNTLEELSAKQAETLSRIHNTLRSAFTPMILQTEQNSFSVLSQRSSESIKPLRIVQDTTRDGLINTTNVQVDVKEVLKGEKKPNEVGLELIKKSEDKTVYRLKEGYVTIYDKTNLPKHAVNCGDEVACKHEAEALKDHLNKCGRVSEANQVAIIEESGRFAFFSPDFGRQSNIDFDKWVEQGKPANTIPITQEEFTKIVHSLRESPYPHTDFMLPNILVKETENGRVFTVIDNCWMGEVDPITKVPTFHTEKARIKLNNDITSMAEKLGYPPP